MKNSTRSWNERHEGSALSWKNAHVFYILLMVMDGLFAIYIIYKCRHCIICHQPRKLNRELSLEEWPQSSSSGSEGPAHARRPSKEMTRRSSEFSDLPLYEEHEKRAKCEENAKMEKRGKYTYSLGRLWPGRRD